MASKGLCMASKGLAIKGLPKLCLNADCTLRGPGHGRRLAGRQHAVMRGLPSPNLIFVQVCAAPAWRQDLPVWAQLALAIYQGSHLPFTVTRHQSTQLAQTVQVLPSAATEVIPFPCKQRN